MVFTMDPADTNFQAILSSPSLVLAERDFELLARPELRPVRLQLELLKPEMALAEQRIRSTVVVFGSTEIVEKKRPNSACARSSGGVAGAGRRRPGPQC